MKNIAVILAGGTGARLGWDKPKQFLKVAGKTVLEHTVTVFQKHIAIDEIAIVVRQGYFIDIETMILKNRWTKVKKILNGGEERYQSSLSAIKAYEKDNNGNINLIFHDSVRPLLSTKIIDDVINALRTEIDCTDKNRDFEKYQGHGWFHKSDSYGTFSVGPSSDLIFKIKDYHNQTLRFSFNALAWVGDLPRRTAKVYVNNNYIRDIVFDEKNDSFSFTIEPSLVKGNELIIRFDIDHSGTAEKDGFQDLGMLWKKMRIDSD